MRVALCLHGLVGTNEKYGTGNKKISAKLAYRHFKERVFDINADVDVFFHTWDVVHEEKLQDLYNPVDYKVEEQPKYSENVREQAIYCRWKSTKEVINLLNNSENEYDFVLLTRFDIAFLVDFDFSTFESDVFYAQGPAGPRKGSINLINDLWFVANQDNIIKFASLYDHLEDPRYQKYLDSNHELARKHIEETGLSSILQYRFNREWNGASGKLNSDTPLIRWHYLKKV